VIVERLPQIPQKPPAIILERWMPYKPMKRKVVFEKAKDNAREHVKPRNLIVAWESPKVTVVQNLKHLGCVRTNPKDYIDKYGDALKNSKEIYKCVKEISPDITLLSDEDYNREQVKFRYELEGDLEALKYVDLDKEGLSEYKEYLRVEHEHVQAKITAQSKTINKELDKDLSSLTLPFTTISNNDNNKYSESCVSSSGQTESINELTIPSSLSDDLDILIEQIFELLDRKETGYIKYAQAESFFTKLNNDLNGEKSQKKSIVDYFKSVNVANEKINLNEFKKIFLNIKFNEID
jgi:hypothetical protein